MGTPVAVPSGCGDEQYGTEDQDMMMKLKLCDFVGALVDRNEESVKLSMETAATALQSIVQTAPAYCETAKQALDAADLKHNVDAVLHAAVTAARNAFRAALTAVEAAHGQRGEL